jgi:phosphatidylglycerol---prolipoprotein diacylglyceryl transferase
VKPIVEVLGVAMHSWYLFMVLGFTAALIVALAEAARVGVDAEAFCVLSFWMIVGALLGSRLFHTIVFYEEYLRDPGRMLTIYEGHVFYGGVIGALVAITMYARRRGFDFWVIADICALALPLGHVFGRIGCFLAGCCFGKPCPPAFPLCVTFEHPLTSAPQGIPLYPTQIFSAANEFVIFCILFAYRKHKRFNGELLAIYLILYGVTRFLLEILRDDPRGIISVASLSFSESQIVSVILILWAGYIFFRVGNPGRRQ